jgi:RNA polymerase sigma-70 factor, ECF subfamily
VSDAPVAWREVATKLAPFIAQRVPLPDVDDVLQDVLLRVHRSLKDLRDEQRLASWMFQIARNAIAENGRARARHPIAEAADLDDTPGEPAEDRRGVDLLASCLTGFVARLPSPYREAVTLVELEGLTAREAAQIVGISLPAMKSRVQRGRAQLRTMLDACCEIAVDARGRVTDVASRSHACCSTGV